MTTDQEWNEQIRQQNEKAIAVAKKRHEVKEQVQIHVLAAMQVLKEAYPIGDDGIAHYPDDASQVVGLLQKAIRVLRSPEQVELLGQAVDEFCVELPAWAQAK